jgi:hypothetical protein
MKQQNLLEIQGCLANTGKDGPHQDVAFTGFLILSLNIIVLIIK